MRTVFLLMLLPVAAHAGPQDSPANGPLVDRKAGRPMLLAFDVDPGYYKQVWLPVDEDDGEHEKTLRISIEPPIEPEWTSGHWNPAVSLCLRPEGDTRQLYCASLNIDRDQAMRTFGVARLHSSSGEQLYRKLTPTMFEPHAKVDLQVVRTGAHVVTRFNGVTIDDGDLGFTPAFWIIGASTGVATIEAIEEVEPPLGPGEWPTTVKAAIAMELDDLSSESKATLRSIPKEGLADFRVGWGTRIINRLGLSRGNRALLEAACGKGCEPAAASMAIMEAVWDALQAGVTQQATSADIPGQRAD